jgi:hypothetical protein
VNEDAKWIIGLGLTVLLLLVGALWKSLHDRIEAIWNQIGRDSRSGMREVVHRTANEMSWVAPELDDLKERVQKLEDKR